MLVLTRKAKQQIQIGPNVTVTILQVKGQAVRIGIDAPREVCVLRTELAEKLAGGDFGDSAVSASFEKTPDESEISGGTDNEQEGGRTHSAKGSLRCRAPRVDVAPLNSPYQSTGPASFLRPRRRRTSIK
jgi:carbon storage regulator